MNLKNIFLLIILITFSFSFLRIMRSISEGKNRLLEVKNEVSQDLKEKENLEKEVMERQSLDFLEREARNRLNLIKPGERMVILPQNNSTDVETETKVEEKGKPLEKPRPNWQKWWELLF